MAETNSTPLDFYYQNLSYVNFSMTPDMYFGPVHIFSICCYTFVFVLSALGNVTMLLILLRNLQKTKLNRVYILLFNLNMADLMVTFFYIPKEIAHNITVQWLASDWLCRFGKYMDVFGIYLSSNILICMSIDRFFAIVRPLDNFKARRRVRIMVLLAWLIAGCTSLPQIYTFCKDSHPYFSWYTQCISIELACGRVAYARNYVLFNTVLNALEIYAMPFVVIVICYGTIMSTIMKEEKHIHRGTANGDNADFNEPRVQLRRSSHCYIRKAKSKTLRMTIVIVVMFLICWTPYFIMVAVRFSQQRMAVTGAPLWERFLYFFAIFNSCLNPYLYGYYSFKLRLELLELGRKCCCVRDAAYRTSNRFFTPGSPTLHADYYTAARYSRGLSLDLSHNENHIVRFREGFLLMEKSEHSQ